MLKKSDGFLKVTVEVERKSKQIGSSLTLNLGLSLFVSPAAAEENHAIA